MQAPATGQVSGAPGHADPEAGRGAGVGARRQVVSRPAPHPLLGALQRQPVRVQHPVCLLQQRRRQLSHGSARADAAAGLHATAASPRKQDLVTTLMSLVYLQD